jgi:ribosomal protein S15P/S13E
MSNTDHNSTAKSMESSSREVNNSSSFDKDYYAELSVIEEQQSVVSSSLPLRERYKHLLEEHMSANYTTEQRKLIQIQNRIDELLDYLRQHRNKEKGQLFSEIKRSMLITHEITLELEHLKQILFICPHFYIWKEKRDERGRLDVLISLP